MSVIIRRWIVVLLCVGPLLGCGKKGPLYLPQEPAKAPAASSESPVRSDNTAVP